MSTTLGRVESRSFVSFFVFGLLLLSSFFLFFFFLFPPRSLPHPHPLLISASAPRKHQMLYRTRNAMHCESACNPYTYIFFVLTFSGENRYHLLEVGLVIGQYEMELQNLSEALTSLSFCLLLTVLLSSFLEYLFLCSITRSAFDRRRRRCSLTTNSCLPCARCFRSFPPQQRGRVLVRSTLEITRPIPIHTTDRVYLCLF